MRMEKLGKGMWRDEKLTHYREADENTTEEIIIFVDNEGIERKVYKVESKIKPIPIPK